MANDDNGRLSLAATSEEDAPRRSRAARRTESMVAAGVDIFRKLPAWAVVLLLSIGMVCYTLQGALAPMLRADDEAIHAAIDERVKEQVAEQLAEQLEAAVGARVKSLVGEALDQRLEVLLDDGGDVARIADERIAAYHQRLGCGPDLALLLRVLGPQTGLLDPTKLPSDLQLCMLLDERNRKGLPP
jgi:hypothetical protein